MEEPPKVFLDVLAHDGNFCSVTLVIQRNKVFFLLKKHALQARPTTPSVTAPAISRSVSCWLSLTNAWPSSRVPNVAIKPPEALPVASRSTGVMPSATARMEEESQAKV